VSVASLVVDRWGTLVLLLWVAWQVYAPKLGVNTRLTEILSSVNGRLDKMGNRIEDIEQRQEETIAVVQVLSVHNDNVDGESVEEIFEENAVSTEEILTDDVWGDERTPPTDD